MQGGDSLTVILSERRESKDLSRLPAQAGMRDRKQVARFFSSEWDDQNDRKYDLIDPGFSTNIVRRMYDTASTFLKFSQWFSNLSYQHRTVLKWPTPIHYLLGKIYPAALM